MKIAAFTMVYNEAMFLPVWLRYYGETLGSENLFVLDNGSNDHSTDDVQGAQRLRVPRGETYDEEERTQFVRNFQRTLLSYYDLVIFCDVDEFIIPDPLYFTGLKDYTEHLASDFVNPIGLEIQHVPDEEPILDWSKPLLSQREYARFSAQYCKPIITKIALNWSSGFHTCEYPPNIDSRLILFHLKRIDRDFALSQLRQRRALSWSANAIKKSHSWHQRLEDPDFDAKFFPFTASTIKSKVSPGFNFSSDLEIVKTHRSYRYLDYEGTIALIPERFKQLIPGVPDIKQPALATTTNHRLIERSTAHTLAHDVSVKLCGDSSPYQNFAHRRFRYDPQGWNSDHPYLSSAVRDGTPEIIVEIGVWKGASIITMAEAVKQAGLKSVIIAIDTWLGSSEHWTNRDWRRDLLIVNGYPSLYYTFLANMVEAGHADRVVPLPLDSQSASEVLRHHQIFPDLIHLDSAHDFDSVLADLKRWWEMLRPGGLLIVDDYDEDGSVWPGVRRAVKEFLTTTAHGEFAAVPYKCRFSKPLFPRL